MITITEKGAEKANYFLKGRLGLRVAITTTGCSGYAYLLEFADTIKEDDTVFKSNGITLVVDSKALTMVDGTEIDYIYEGLNEGFQFKNPNEKAQCGCGESFTL